MTCPRRRQVLLDLGLAGGPRLLAHGLLLSSTVSSRKGVNPPAGPGLPLPSDLRVGGGNVWVRTGLRSTDSLPLFPVLPLLSRRPPLKGGGRLHLGCGLRLDERVGTVLRLRSFNPRGRRPPLLLTPVVVSVDPFFFVSSAGRFFFAVTFGMMFDWTLLFFFKLLFVSEARSS